MRNAECGIELEGRSPGEARVDIPHSAFRTPHPGRGTGRDDPDHRRRIQRPPLEDACRGRRAPHRGPRARGVVLDPAALDPRARVLDLFAGSGALGFEALSRGAVSADFVELHRFALATLKANVQTLKVDDRAAIHRADALRFAERLHPGQYDVAFADPPYAGQEAARLVAMFRLNAFARIFSIEHPADQPIPGDDTRRSGDTAVTFIYAP